MVGVGYSIFTMTYKMFILLEGKKKLIASTNNFSDFQNLMTEFDKFEIQWEVTENYVTVFSTMTVK
jgi:hypothetical protein